MKYAIWRHENALGNSAEHTIGLCKHLIRVGDKDPTVYVETDFQKAFAMCIPGISPENIIFFEEGIYKAIINETIANDPRYSDIHMPSVYKSAGLKTYPASWRGLSKPPDCTLRFPEKYYENKHNLPEDAIVIQVREVNTFWKRVDGASADLFRFVNPQTFFEIAKYFADKGYKVVRIGDSKQVSFPEHKNILDFALVKDRTMLDDLYLISKCKVFLSCDSAIWPMAGAMKKNLVLSNVTSIFGHNPRVKIENGEINFILKKPEIVDWLPKETTKVLQKKVLFTDRAGALCNLLKLVKHKMRLPTGPVRGGIPLYVLLPFADRGFHVFTKFFGPKVNRNIVEIIDNSFEELVDAIQCFL